jgi:EmrB/QacA subfamily drug resistance transporter
MLMLAIPREFLAPLIVAFAMFMESMDANVIATSLPAMARDFHSDPVVLQIGVIAYVVGLGIFIPICGWVADRFGALRVFQTAIGVFVAGSLLCAASMSLPYFVLARFVQGIGGAMMVPVGRIIIFRAVPRSDFVRAMNYLSLPALLGPAAGPVLGGFITTYLHWRLIFGINVPVGIAGIWLAQRYIKNSREPHPGPLDWVGFALSAGGGATFLLGISVLGGGLVSTGTALILLAIGVVLAGLYVLYAFNIEKPLLNLRFLLIPTFQASVAGGSLFRMGLGALPILLPLSLQTGLGMSAFASGMITCASAFGSFLVKWLAPTALRRWGFRTVLMYNAVFSAAAIAVCGAFIPGTPVWAIWVIVLFSGFFPSLQFTSLNSLAYSDIATRDIGRATSLASFVQQMSLGLGVALASVVLHLTRYLQGHDALTWSDFWPAFVTIGCFSLGSIPITRRMPADAGAEIAGGRSRR